MIEISPKDTQMANNHMKGCIILVVVTKIQIKATKRCHYVSYNLRTKIKTEIKCWRAYGEIEMLIHC